MDFQDKTLVCKDCGKEFVFSAGEQAFYAEKGFENEPARCHECRDKRRREREGGKDPAHLFLGEMQVALDVRRGLGNADPVDVGDHRQGDGEDDDAVSGAGGAELGGGHAGAGLQRHPG